MNFSISQPSISMATQRSFKHSSLGARVFRPTVEGAIPCGRPPYRAHKKVRTVQNHRVRVPAWAAVPALLTAVTLLAKKKWVSFPLRLALTLALFAFLFRSLSWSSLLAAIEQAQRLVILLGLLVGVLGLQVSALQWQRLLQAERIHVDLIRLIKLYLIGTAFSHFLPTGMGGDVVKAFYIGRQSRNFAASASAIVMTRLTGYFAMQLIAFTALSIFHAYFSKSIILSAVLLSLLVGSIIGGIILLTILLPKIVKRPHTKQRLIASAIPVGQALIKTIQRPRLLCNVTSIGVVFWILSVLNYYTYAYALNMHVPLYFYFVAIPIVSLIAFLPITINGFGLRESAFVYFFSTMRVPVASSLLLALIMDVQVLFFGLIGGCLYLTMNSEERTIKQRSTEYSIGRRSIADRKAHITWFTKEDEVVFDQETLAFDDSTPTLPMMLLSSRRSAVEAAASAAPVLQDIRRKAVFGKNRRIILVRDEGKVATVDE